MNLLSFQIRQFFCVGVVDNFCNTMTAHKDAATIDTGVAYFLFLKVH